MKRKNIDYQYVYPVYKYGVGDWLKQNVNKDTLVNALTGRQSDIQGLGLGTIGNVVGSTVSGLVSNGYDSTAGKVFDVVGDIGSMIPGPWGAIIGGGAKILGGATNALFGEKVDQNKLNQVNSNINSLNSFQSNASSFDEIQLPMAVASANNVYSGGLFNTSASKKNEALNDELMLAEQWANRSVDNNIQNIKANQINQMMRNYKKDGGSLSSIYIKPSNRGKFTASAKRAGMGVQEYASHILANKEDYSPTLVKRANFARNASKWKHDFGGDLLTNGGIFSNGYTWIGNGYHHSENSNEGVPVGISPDGIPNLVEQNEFIWRDAPDGEYVFAADSDNTNKMKVPKEILDKYHMKEGTTFAEVAKKISKESKERPNDPISKNGRISDLTELMQAQEEVRTANQAKDIKKDLKKQLNNLTPEETLALQEQMPYGVIGNSESQEYAEGGLFGRKFDGTGKYPNRYYTSPYVYNSAKPASILERAGGLASLLNKLGRQHRGEGINMLPYERAWQESPQYLNQFQIAKILKENPELTDEEFIKEFASNMLPYYQEYINSSNTPSVLGASQDTDLVAENLDSPIIDNINSKVEPFIVSAATRVGSYKSDKPSIQKAQLRDFNIPFDKWEPLNTISERAKSINASRPDKITFTGVSSNNNIDQQQGIDEKLLPTWMRYAPIAGSAISAVSSLFDKPDYSNAEAIERASQVTPRQVSYTPLGDYITYRPFDTNYYLNALRSGAAASRRLLANTSGGNRGALASTILASDYNTLIKEGELARQAEEYNRAQQLQAAEFNRGTNQTNAEMSLQASKANQDAYLDAARLGLSGITASSQMRESIDQNLANQRSANLTNLFNNLGALGEENYNKNDRDWYIRNIVGTLPENPQDWSEEQWKDYQTARKLAYSRPFKNGGKLNKRKGLTY